jgi:Zn-dependent carboxypeptidase
MKKMEEYLGVRPTTDSEGVLQDVHWSFGAFGYFPTYTLGNLYSVQFYNQARRELPGLDDSCARGDFSGLLGWLRKNIHIVGRGRKAEELVLELTGQELSAQPFMDYLEAKYKSLYSID